jgi:CTP:molybdopterin cytidylyltransferase MocA
MTDTGIILIAHPSCAGNSGFLAYPEFDAALQSALESGLTVFVVLDRCHELWESRLEALGIQWGVCPDSDAGLAHCVAYGIHCNQDKKAWIVDIASAPYTKPESYVSLSEAMASFEIATLQPSPKFTGNGRSERQFPVAFRASMGFKLLDPKSGLIDGFDSPEWMQTPENQSDWQRLLVKNPTLPTA